MKVTHLPFLLFFCLFFMQARAQCPPLTNNLLKGAATVCAAENSGDVYLGDPLFSVQEWMYSTDNVNWTLLPGTANTYTYTNLTQTTYFKANVLFDVCAAVPTNVITVEVIPASVAGVITGITKGCRFTHSGMLTLEGYFGVIQDWLVYDTLTNVWTPGGNTTHQYNFTNLPTETQYKAVVKNSICPPDTSNPAVVEVYLLPEVDFNDPSDCLGTPMTFTGDVQKRFEADNVVTSYLWNFDDGTSSTLTVHQKTYSNARVYDVRLTAVTNNNCSSSRTRPVTVYHFPVAGFTVENACLNYPASLVNTSFINSAETLQYTWDLADGNYSNSRDVEHTYNFSGSFPVSLKVISGQGHCVDSALNIVEVYAPPVIEVGENVTTSLGVPVQLAASGGHLYSWTPAEGLSATHIATPVATPVHTTVYVVEGTNVYGCVSMDSVTVFITRDNVLYPATLVTPDGNGKNDTWVINNAENYPQALVQLFDMHGREVFSTRNYRNDWAGRNQNGDALPDGTYYYVITFDDGNNRIYKGPITVLRNR